MSFRESGDKHSAADDGLVDYHGHSYSIGPFVMRSEFPITELPLANAEDIPNVWVHYGTVPKSIEDAGTKVDTLEVARRETLLRISDVAEILIRDGCEVIVQPVPGAIESDLRAYLSGTVFGVLCHQNGMLPLHASSIRVGSGVVAFLGDSGAGKSTLAAFLARRGYAVVSDDICLLDFDPDGNPIVVPVAPWMKLWRNTAEELGRSAEGVPRVFSDEDKYRFNVDAATGRLPLKQVMVLDWLDQPDLAVKIERLGTLSAIESMMEFTYQSYLIEGMGRTRECFQLCGRALNGIGAFRLQRARGFEHIEEILDGLEAHFKDAGDSAEIA